MKVKEKMIGGVAMTQNLTYTRCGDYLIPNIQLSNTSDKPLGKYGRMRRAFLAENNPILLDDIDSDGNLIPALVGNRRNCSL